MRHLGAIAGRFSYEVLTLSIIDVLLCCALQAKSYSLVKFPLFLRACFNETHAFTEQHVRTKWLAYGILLFIIKSQNQKWIVIKLSE